MGAFLSCLLSYLSDSLRSFVSDRTSGDPTSSADEDKDRCKEPLVTKQSSVQKDNSESSITCSIDGSTCHAEQDEQDSTSVTKQSDLGDEEDLLSCSTSTYSSYTDEASEHEEDDKPNFTVSSDTATDLPINSSVVVQQPLQERRQRFMGTRRPMLTRAASQGQEKFRQGMWSETLQQFRKGETPSSQLGYGDHNSPDLGYGNTDTIPDLGYGVDSSVPADLGYGEADHNATASTTRGYNSNDLGYHSDHIPLRRKQPQGMIRRRCSVTKYSLEASAKATAELAQEERERFLFRQESMKSACCMTESEDEDDDYSESFAADDDSYYSDDDDDDIDIVYHDHHEKTSTNDEEHPFPATTTLSPPPPMSKPMPMAA